MFAKSCWGQTLKHFSKICQFQTKKSQKHWPRVGIFVQPVFVSHWLISQISLIVLYIKSFWKFRPGGSFLPAPVKRLASLRRTVLAFVFVPHQQRVRRGDQRWRRRRRRQRRRRRDRRRRRNGDDRRTCRCRRQLVELWSDSNQALPLLGQVGVLPSGRGVKIALLLRSML